MQLAPNFRLASAGQQFGIFVEAKNLRLQGEVSYDDNRDTVPDRVELSEGLGAFEFTIQYDPAVLSVEGAEEGPQVQESARGFQCLRRTDEPGSISLGCFSPGAERGLTEDLTLATVTFLPVKQGSTYLEMEAGLAGPLGDDMPAEVEGALVQIGPGTAVTATPPGLPAGGETGTPAPSGDGPQPTQGSSGTVTPAGAVATVPPGEQDATPSPAQSSVREDTDDPGDSAGDFEAQNERSSGSGGSSPWPVTLWSLGIAGAVVAAVAVAFAAVQWQRQR